MTRSLRSFALIGLTALLLAALAALVLVPPLLDWNRYRSDFAFFLTNALGVDVRIEGDVSLHLLPRPRMSVQEASIGTLARAETLALESDWLAILKGSLQVRSAEARGVEMTVKRTGEEGWRLPVGELPFESLDIFGGTIFIRDEILGIDEEALLVSAQIESGRIVMLLATPESSLGESLDMRFSYSDADFSLQARADGGELRLSGTGALTAKTLALEAMLDARLDSGITGEEVHLRTQVSVREDAARFSEISAQWGESHWRGDGEIDAITTAPMLRASLHSGIFDASRGLELLEALAGVQDKAAAVRGEIALEARSVSWQGESAGEGALTVRLDGDKEPDLHIALERLPGGGFAHWRGRVGADSESFVGTLNFSAERPEYITFVPFLSNLKRPFRLKGDLSGSLQNARLENFELDYGANKLQGRILYDSLESLAWNAELHAESLAVGAGIELFELMEAADSSKESKLSLSVGELLADSMRLGTLEMQLHLLQEGVSLKNLRLDKNASGLLLEASGNLSWSRDKPEGSLDAHLSAPSEQARDNLASMLMALNIREGDWFKGAEPLSLRGEWKFTPQQSDKFKLDGEVGAAQVRLEAEDVFDVFFAEESAQASAQAPLQASWQRQEDFILLEGVLEPFPNFFGGTLKVGGFDAEFPLALQAELSAISDNQGRRIFWEELRLAETGVTLRGSGWITEVVNNNTWRFQTDLDADNIEEVPVSQWHSLALLGETFSSVFNGTGTGTAAMRGILFGGEANIKVDISADISRARWRATIEDGDLSQASEWLWGGTFMRGIFNASLEATGNPIDIDLLTGNGNARLSGLEICCIDIDGLRSQALEGVVVISVFATPRLGRSAWMQIGDADFLLALQNGILEQRTLGLLEGVSNTLGQLDLRQRTLQLQADFPVAVGSNGESAPLTYRIEGDVFEPTVSFDSITLEQALEGSRLGQILEQLEAPQ